MDPTREIATKSTNSASTCDNLSCDSMPAAPRPKFLQLPEDMPELVLEDLSDEEESINLQPEKKRSPTESNRHLSQPRVFAGSDSRACNDGCAKNHRAVKRHSTSLKPARREEFYSDKNSLLGSTTWWPNAASSSSSR